MSPAARVSRRIAAIEESATRAVDAKAKALQAAGEDVIGVGTGEPDLPTPDHVVAAAAEAAPTCVTTATPPPPALPELRAAVAAKTARDSGYEVKASQVLITNVAKQAVYNTLAALLDPATTR